jgi:hypothetical protein
VWILSKALEEVEDEESEKPFEKRKKRAMAAMARVRKRIGDLGFGLSFVGL